MSISVDRPIVSNYTDKPIVSNNTTQGTPAQSPTQEQTTLNPQEQLSVNSELTNKPKNDFNPAGFQFVDKQQNKTEEVKGPVKQGEATLSSNMKGSLSAILGILAVIVGGGAAAYNPTLMDNFQKQLSMAVDRINKNVDGVEVKDDKSDVDKFKKLSSE